jgi:hypothetical protein
MLRLFDKRLLALAGVAGLLLWGAAANAQSISIGYDENNGAAPALGVPGNVLVNASANLDSSGVALLVGNFAKISVGENAVAGVNSVLDSSVFTLTTTGAGYVNIYVTLQDIPHLASAIFSPTVTFNSGDVGAGVSTLVGSTLKGSAYYSSADAQWALGDLLGASGALGLPSSNQTLADVGRNTPALFSVTEVFQIYMSGPGDSTAHIDLGIQESERSLGAPLPAALPLFGSVLGGGLLFGRLRNRRKVKAKLAAV